MASEDPTKLHKLEDLKNKLFSRNYRAHSGERGGFSSQPPHEAVPDSWNDQSGGAFENKILVKTSLFKKIFVVSLAFFVLSLGYAAYVMLAGSNTVSNDNIDITVTGNSFTAGGEELELVIGIANKNATALDLVDLVVEYPKGSNAALPSETERLRSTLGTIPAGAVRNESLKLVLFGEQGSVRPIKIAIEYRVAGSNAIFLKEKTYDVTINSTPINLSVEGPLSVSPNQDITLNIKTGLNSTKPAEDILVKLDYPLGFQFTKAVPKPSYGDDTWFLGDLAPGAEHSISIYGKMVDVYQGEDKTFHVTSGSQASADKSSIDVTFNSTRHTVSVKRPFLEATMAVNAVAGTSFAVNSKSAVDVEVRYANNLSTKVDDVRIEAKISGNAWNRSTVRAPQGYYESARDTIVWDKNTYRSLAEVNPGDSGSVSFSVSPLPLYSAAGSLLPEPTIYLTLSIFGRQSIEDASVDELKNSASASIKIISDLAFSAKALYYSGPFKNTGPVPPKVDTDTTFTIVWTLSNTANNISGARLATSLPAWVSFAGAISPPTEDLSYNASTREVIWNIGRVPKGSGLTGASRSAAFQVTLKPSLSQLGSTPLLTQSAVLTGHDDFANVDLRSEKVGLTTRLESDPGFKGNDGVVAE